MFSFSQVLSQTGSFISTGIGVIDPTTSVGGLVMAGLGVAIVFGVLRRIKGVVPR